MSRGIGPVLRNVSSRVYHTADRRLWNGQMACYSFAMAKHFRWGRVSRPNREHVLVSLVMSSL